MQAIRQSGDFWKHRFVVLVSVDELKRRILKTITLRCRVLKKAHVPIKNRTFLSLLHCFFVWTGKKFEKRIVWTFENGEKSIFFRTKTDACGRRLILQAGSKFWVREQYPAVWSLKWYLFDSTFTWCYLFFNILQNDRIKFWFFFFCLAWFWHWFSFCFAALLQFDFPKQTFFFKVTNDLQGLSFYRVCELWSRKYWRHSQFWGLHEDGARQGKPKGESRSFNWVVELHGSCSYRVRLIDRFSEWDETEILLQNSVQNDTFVQLEFYMHLNTVLQPGLQMPRCDKLRAWVKNRKTVSKLCRDYSSLLRISPSGIFYYKFLGT